MSTPGSPDEGIVKVVALFLGIELACAIAPPAAPAVLRAVVPAVVGTGAGAVVVVLSSLRSDDRTTRLTKPRLRTPAPPLSAPSIKLRRFCTFWLIAALVWPPRIAG